MPTQWHIARDGTEIGKATSDELRSMARTGALLPSDQVWRDGMSEWRPAKSLSGLFSSEPPPPPPSSASSPMLVDEISIDTRPPAKPAGSKQLAKPTTTLSPTVCWAMIGAGALDLIGWLLTGYGWTNVLLGDNVLTQYGPWALIVAGGAMLQHQPASN